MLRAGLGMLGLTQIRHVAPVGRRAARDLTKRVYAEVERDFGVLGPPVVLHANAPEVLAGSWLMVRETLVASGAAPQPAREAVATAVSASNSCPYCVAIHGHALGWWVRGGPGGRPPLEDPTVSLTSAWATGTGRRDADHTIPFPKDQLPELGGVALLLHYTNRMVNVFLRDAPMPPGVPGFMLTPVMKVLGPVMRSAPGAAGQPGVSLDLLPEAPLPTEFGWLAGNPAVAGAYARAAAAIERGGQRSVPVGVRDLVTAELAAWDGEPRGISRSWASAAADTLDPADRALGTLALLVAFSSYQVDTIVIRQTGLGDQALTEVCAWASMAATRRIASWLG